MAKRVVHLLFEEGNVVYFTFDEATPYVVRGFEVRNEVISYVLYNPEVGETYALGNEISTERNIF